MISAMPYILAGGRSRRFGRDKARATVAGRPMIQRIAEALSSGSEIEIGIDGGVGVRGGLRGGVTVVASEVGAYADLGLRTIADRLPGRGPLAGVAAALADPGPASEAAASDWCLIVACDWVDPDLASVEPLVEAVTRDPGRRAAAYREAEGRWRPLPMLLHRGAGRVVERQLAAGRDALWQLLEVLGAAGVPLDAMPGALRHANTPQQLAAATAGVGR